MRYREAKGRVNSLLEPGIGSEEVLRSALWTMTSLCDEAMRDRGDMEADLAQAKKTINALEMVNSASKKQPEARSEEINLLHAQGKRPAHEARGTTKTQALKKVHTRPEAPNPRPHTQILNPKF